MADTDTPRSEMDTPRFERAPSRVQHVYLLRAPLLTIFGLGFFCYAAFFTGARLLLGNAFDIESRWGIFFVSLTAFLCGWVVMVSWRLVRLHGPERFFGTASLPAREGAWWQGLLYYALIPLVAFPVVLGAIGKSTVLSTGGELLKAGLGFLVPLFCLAMADLVRLYFIRPEVAQESPYLFFPTTAGRGDPRIAGVRTSDPGLSRLVRSILGHLVRLPGVRQLAEKLGQGYFKYDENGRIVWFLPGHITAFAVLAVTFGAYLLIGWGDLILRIEDGERPLIPTLSYIMLLAMLLCWVFFGLAFFFDRYRIPVLIPLVAWLAFTSCAPGVIRSDYFYPVTESAQEDGSTTAATEVSDDNSIIVVAANGGGIQAAAWAAQVLTGLEKRCGAEPKCGDRFGEKIRLISSASGGSVGTMYFVNEYTEKGPPADRELKNIVERAEGSSLDEISWGLVYADLRRTFFPALFFRYQWDRGRALEEAWSRKGDRSWDRKEGIQEGLSEWREDSKAGWRPGVIFNTTAAESGERVPLATTDLPQGSPGEIGYAGLFGTGEQEHDIAVVTAARLSAAFPYVSPAARADIEGEAPHIVDGGYYDNYGISSLVEWLDAELEKPDNNIDRVLVVEIRGAPSNPGYTHEGQKCPTRPTKPPDRKSQHGWLYQALAPAATVLNVRNTGQRTHNDVELDLLVDKWEGDVEITRALFEFDGGDTPLSWHLTNEQKRKIQTEWAQELNDPRDTCAGWDRVQEFLSSEGEG